MDSDIKPKTWGWLVLFASTGTLLCCALPILLVSLGMGAVVASLATNFPVLIALSLHKGWVFTGSGFLLLFGAWALYRPGRSCPSEPEVGRICEGAHKWNRRLYWGAIAIWSIGFFAAFLLLPLSQWLGL